ncbi:MAG: CAP domain-containing protein, partial [Ktedonobacteraceae bacterium]|nr:CAP domain-containing protein [Ktedonobacteraceae bacterium]
TPTPRPPTPTPKPAGGNGSNGGSSGGTNGGGGGSTTTGQPSALEQQLLQTINQDRAANGLPAYAWEPRLQKSGYQHNLVMAGGCGLSHQCSGEPALGTRISNQGVNWTSCGENIGTGGPVQATSSSQWSMVSTLHKDMMGEQPPNDGHRKNLLSSSFHRIGISIYVDANNSLWLTEDFAS